MNSPDESKKEIEQFLWKQQFPVVCTTSATKDRAADSGGGTATSSSSLMNGGSGGRTIKPLDHVKQVALETCRCRHLQEYLPHLLEMNYCKTPKLGFIPCNPIHALHLKSQWKQNEEDPSSSASSPRKASKKKSASLIKQRKDQESGPLYGEEQQRTRALYTRGIAEHWCPLDGYSAAVLPDFESTVKMAALVPKEAIPSSGETADSIAGAESVVKNDGEDAVMSPSNNEDAVEDVDMKVDADVPEESPSEAAVVEGDGNAGNAESSENPEDPSDVIPDSTGDVVPSVLSVEESSGDKDLVTSERIEASVVEEKEDSDQRDEAAPETAPSSPPKTGVAADGKTSSSSDPSAALATKGEEETHTNEDGEGDPTEKDTAMDVDTDIQQDISTKPDATNVDSNNEDQKIVPSSNAEASTSVLQDTTKMQDSTPTQPTDVISNEVAELMTIDPTECAASGEESQDDAANKEGKEEEEKEETSTEKRDEDQPAVVSSTVVALLKEESVTKNETKKEESTKDNKAKDEATILTAEKSDSTKIETKQISDCVVEDEKRMPEDGNVDVDQSTKEASKPDDNVQKDTETPIKSELIVSQGDHVTLEATTSQPVVEVLSSGAAVITPEEEATPNELNEDQFKTWKREEDKINAIRSSLVAPRVGLSSSKKKVDTKKKRKRDNSDISRSIGGPLVLEATPIKELSAYQEDEWGRCATNASVVVQSWMDRFRKSREAFWEEKTAKQKRPVKVVRSSFYLFPENDVEQSSARCCHLCSEEINPKATTKKRRPRRILSGDSLMQCLECDFIGCAPSSMVKGSSQCILQHLLLSGHRFAVTCGERANLFCFGCGDLVYHEAFEQEKERIDYAHQLSFMAWKHCDIQRSFDAFQFIKTQDYGIVWRGLVATYPSLVPRKHVASAEVTYRRQALFEGRVQEPWLMNINMPTALRFCAKQSLLPKSGRHNITAPVGMYNLGNTCFKSSILQCLVHCRPLQRFFLEHVRHDHNSCKLYRSSLTTPSNKASTGEEKASGSPPKMESICLACEMDRLFLSYFGSTIGVDVISALNDVCVPVLPDREDLNELQKGDPLVISEMLTSSWRSGGMDHLAGYEQRDAHEFLNSFLELMGKHVRQQNERVEKAISAVQKNNGLESPSSRKQADIIEELFLGSLRSVLLCEECGTKRIQQEAFMNISLTIPEAGQRQTNSNKQLSIEECLQHFVKPEMLGDPVQCPACNKKTPTKKQHTFSKYPKVLCLHLKRFDASRNQKIEDFITFPANGLNMGQLLSHWVEVSSIPASDNNDAPGEYTEPCILYDLFGTANHLGTMQSGHYVANVKVEDKWYRCNDAHVAYAGEGNGEEAVLKSDGAYVLFYIRRE